MEGGGVRIRFTPYRIARFPEDPARLSACPPKVQSHSLVMVQVVLGPV